MLEQSRSVLKHKKSKNRILPYILLIPTLLFLILFTFYPFIRSIYLSFFVTDAMGSPGTFVGLKNFERILTSDTFQNSLLVTFKYAAMVGVGTFCGAMFLAFLCVKERKGCKIYQTMYSIPIALASAPIAALALYIFSRNGILNNILGTKTMWLSTKETAMICLAVCSCWAGMGSSFIYLLVGFRNVPDDLIEGASLDGAGYITKFFKIYLPVASPQVFYVVFLNIVGSFKAFALIKILVGSGPAESTNVLVYALYSNAFSRGRFETACVYSLVLCAIIFVATRIQFFCEKRWVHYQ